MLAHSQLIDPNPSIESLMAAVSVAAEWQLLYNRYYRKPEIYSMQWSRMDLTRHRVAPAPFAGPIAAIRDDSKIVQLYAESARRKLHIFNSAGVLLSSAVWDRPGGRLVGMSWTDDQALICVVQDGTVYRYNIHAELQEPHISMGKECFEQNVVECVFWGNGMVCLTESSQLFCVPDFKNPKPCKLADPGLDEYPLCVAVIEPQYTMSGNVEVLLAVNDYVLVVDEEGVQQMGVGIGPLQKMAVSRNGKLLASFTHDGRLLVITTDFSKIIFEYNCESALPPEQLAWCGMDSVLLYWDEMLLMVGPYGDLVIFPALDIQVKNVARTYSLEHKGESELFDHLFELLNSNVQNDDSFRRELASCTGAIQTSVSQHMSKEEEQVFPLLIDKFTFEEQAALVWQFLCNIPVNMMAEFLPWLSSSISPDEHQDMLKCLRKVVPEEKLLQQALKQDSRCRQQC